MTKMRSFLFLLGFFLVSLLTAQNNARFVNVFIGTDGTGHTFPGPSMPFGMVQPGPDNRDQGWNYTSGYQYRDTVLLGFSQTRLSGTGISEMGDLLLLPFSEKADPTAKNRYFKESEKASVGYYSVLKKDGVKVELTCSERVAFHRYTFPGSKARVLADFQHGLRFLTDSLVLASEIRQDDKFTFSGYCRTKNWVERTWFFVLKFDQPVLKKEELQRNPKEKAPRYILSFDLVKEKTLGVKIALSTVDVAGAKNNMQTEVPAWDFNLVRERAEKSWNEYLNRIEIEAPDSQKVVFYTALYHLLLQPADIADADGRYRGADDKVATAIGGVYYSTLSIWDIYRAAFPLLQIIAPEKIDGIVNTMLLHHKTAGFLPIWTVWGKDNYCMIGNHSIPMILSAWNNGFRGFDSNEALRAMVETSTRSHINSDWELYDRYGYYPFDKLDNEAVSRTLESGYDDWCVAEMARKLGDTSIAGRFTQRAGYYRNLFDPETKLFRGKNTLGNWRIPFDPLKATSPMNNPGDYTEANAWQYFWTPAQYDVAGMQQLLGGREAFTRHLDTFFTTEAKKPDKFLGQEAMIGQYAHGNEPGHHVIYLYAFSDKPVTGQQYINQVVNRFHKNSPDGMIGNDDCGQMSAWYIFSTLGFYPVNPATGAFVTGVPQVKNATIRLSSGKKFEILARDFTGGTYIAGGVLLNNTPLDKKVVNYGNIMNGGELIFEPGKPDPSVAMPLPEKYQRFPVGSIKPSGWLKEQMKGDMAGFVGHLDQLVPDLIHDPIYGSGRLHKQSKAKDLGNLKSGDAEGDEQYKWWNSETQSNWWDGYIRNALLLDDQQALEKVRLYLKRMLQSQDPDGYLGIYDSVLRYKFKGENGELWAKTTLCRGLLAWYEATGDEAVRTALNKAVDNVMTFYPVNQSNPFFAGKEFSGGVAHGLTFTDVLDRMHQLTGDRKYTDYAAFLYRNFSANYSSETDSQLSSILDPEYRLKMHGVHTYEHLRPLTVATYATGDPVLAKALKTYVERIGQCTTPTGGAIGDEWIAGRVADATNTGYEYCSLHELLDSYTVLLQKSGDLSLAEAIERIFYNAAQGSRDPGHSCIAYLKTDNSYEMAGTRNGEAEPGRKQTRYKYSPAHQDVAVCCAPNAGRISPGFIQSAWLRAGNNTLVAAVLGPTVLETKVGDVPVKIEEITNYPYDNRFTFQLTTGKPVHLRVCIRKPVWAVSAKCSEPYTYDEGFLVIDRIFNGTEVFDLAFSAEIKVSEDQNQEKFFTLGALVFAKPLEARIKPGRVYIPGFRDYEYTPKDLSHYKFCKNNQAVFSDGKIMVTLTNVKTGKDDRVELIPVGKTILRQTTFK